MHRGTARYHLDDVFLASSRKSAEPKKEITLNSSIRAMKRRPDASKPEIVESGVVMGINPNTMDTKPVTQAIKKAADVKARAIFIFINSSP